MRLAYLLSQYPAINHTYLLREVAGLRKLGVDVHVASILAPDRVPEKLMPEEREEARSAFYVKRAGLRGTLWPHLRTLFSTPGRYLSGLCHAVRLGGADPWRAVRAVSYFAEAVVVGRWMASQKLSHVHIHYASGVGLFLPRMFPVTVSNSMHGPAEFEDPRGFRLAEKIEASLFVRAISQYGRSQLMRAAAYAHWDKIVVNRLGVDTRVFEPRPFRRNPAPFEIACVGRLSPEKGQHVLLAAVERLVREGRNIRLKLAGDGPDRASLERHAAERGLSGCVVFEGWVNQDRLRELYGGTDLCVMPSFLEGIPVALMEPMAMGIPCIATRITGIPELIEDGVNGTLVAPADHEELACAIARMMDAAEWRERMGEAAMRRIRESYDLSRNIELLAAVFERWISQSI